MILYNITVSIDPEVEEAWKHWMKNTHIPDVLQTNCFMDHRFFKLLTERPDVDGITYAIQYFAETMEALDRYQEKFAGTLQEKHYRAFPERFVAFRTILEEV